MDTKFIFLAQSHRGHKTSLLYTKVGDVLDLNYPRRFHSSESKVRPNIDSASRIIIRNWGTENSSLEGMVKR